MNFFKGRKWVTLLLAIVCIVGALPVYSQITDNRPTEVFQKPLVKVVMWIQNRLEPTTDGTGRVGTEEAWFGASFVDSSRVREHIIVGDVVGGPNGSLLMLVANNTASSITAGDFCVWDSTQIVVVDSTVSNVGAAAATVADSLFRHAGKFTLVCEANGTPNADTVVVKGVKWGTSVAVIDSLVLTASAGSFSQFTEGSSPLYWTRVDSVSLAGVDGALSVQVAGIPYASVIPSGSATTTFAGVAVETIAAADSGYVCFYGPVDGVVDAATSIGYPGKMIELSSGGDAVIDAAPTTGQNVGRLLEFSAKDNWMTRVFIDSY